MYVLSRPYLQQLTLRGDRSSHSQGTHKSPFNVDRFTPVVIIPLDIDIQKPTTFGQTLQTTIFMTRGRLELQMQEARKEQP